MSRVVPSDVVGYIERSFPGLEQDGSGRNMLLESGHAPVVAPLVALLDNVPGHLLALVPPGDHVQYLVGVAVLRTALDNWRFGTHSAWQARITALPAYRKHPVAIVRDVLASCPDQAPALATAELAFLGDPDLQADLRLDLSQSLAELADGEFKSATVLSGATIETLLYWAVGQRPTADIAAAAASVKKPHLQPGLQRWALDDFVKVAEHLHIITAQTAKAADAAKDFRNLIHPERAARHGLTCNQATAMSAYAAALHVIGDLEVWNTKGRP